MSGPFVEIQEITDEVLADYYATASNARAPKAEPAPEDNLAPAATTTAPAATTEQRAAGGLSVPTVDLSPGPILRGRYRRFDEEEPDEYEPRAPVKRKKKKKSKGGFDWGWVLIPALALLFLTSRQGPAPPMNMGTSGLASLL